jgi:uncharacterized protein
MSKLEIPRSLNLPKDNQRSFFLWGTRKVGKSFLLRKTYPESEYINLLNSKLYLKYLKQPWLLREELLALKSSSKLIEPIIIDEVQRVPLLLDEVHLLIEEHDMCFVLCGSSARKLKQGQANLLGGRALRYELHGFSAYELDKIFNLDRILNHGYIPEHYLEEDPQWLIEAYVNDYLEQEIAAEALVRNIPSFASFLEVASLSDTELVNFANIARDCGVAAPTVKEYFQILEDTLLAKFLPAYRKKPKRRVIQASKFYYSDVGVVNYLSKRKQVLQGSELFGKAFENWVFHELDAYRAYSREPWELSYWRLASGSAEVDFIINDMELAIEAKASSNIYSDHLKGLRELIKDHPDIKKRIVVSLVDKDRITDDGIEIISVTSFVDRLWANKL